MKKSSKSFEAELVALGKRVTRVRKKLGLSQKDFAKTLALTPRIIGLYERGLSKPGFEFFSQVVQSFQINPYYLFTGKGKCFFNTDEAEDQTTLPDESTLNEDGIEMFEYYKKSKIVRLNLHAYFSSLLVREGDTIRKEIEKQNPKK